MAVKNSLVQPKEVLGYIPWSMDRLITEEEKNFVINGKEKMNIIQMGIGIYPKKHFHPIFSQILFLS